MRICLENWIQHLHSFEKCTFYHIIISVSLLGEHCIVRVLAGKLGEKQHIQQNECFLNAYQFQADIRQKMSQLPKESKIEIKRKAK